MIKEPASRDATVASRAERLRVNEIFHSLQGEADAVGFPTVFVRLTGCPLRCRYCDTEYAFHAGDWTDVDAVLGVVAGFGARYVCVTGGEPLAQPNCLLLLTALCDAGYRVSLETSGALDISGVDARVATVLDVKTPGSGEERRNRIGNLALLKPIDQVKFVITSRDDYEWSRAFVRQHDLTQRCQVLFSPGYHDLKPVTLAEWILTDRLDVRFQLQLHKVLWGDVPENSVPRAVILLSGGLDSATTLALARAQGFDAYALSVHYGQRHSAELDAAARVAASLGAFEHRVMRVDLAGIGGSALTDAAIAVPEAGLGAGIPVTYVPARNTMMLALALGWAEVLGAGAIFVGVNAVDYSGYPDCRPEFIAAFEALARVATKAGVEGAPIRVHAPLIRHSKADIIRDGLRLGVDYGLTVSCYQADGEGRACGRCDSCRIRAAGFAAAGVADPTRYR